MNCCWCGSSSWNLKQKENLVAGNIHHLSARELVLQALLPRACNHSWCHYNARPYHQLISACCMPYWRTNFNPGSCSRYSWHTCCKTRRPLMQRWSSWGCRTKTCPQNLKRCRFTAMNQCRNGWTWKDGKYRNRTRLFVFLWALIYDPYPKWYWRRWHCTYLVTFALCQRRKATTLLHATASTVTSTCGKKGQETPDLIISKRSALFLSSNYSTSKSTLYQLYSLVSFGWLLAQHFVIPWFFKCQIRIRCGNVMLLHCSIRNKAQGNNCWVDCNSFASSSLPQRCSTHLALTIDWLTWAEERPKNNIHLENTKSARTKGAGACSICVE